ncbi:rRNA maturation RNase YbeY [Telmatospirillum sp. J64-1]|uniref:rRNA maturation RNase YbeY n=1 Tax=Telmatospirillum sp. J64-1 TaxID=2502183 RepID=UPI00115F436D|nr:rRNA maturation RNase YbeY [Telmatospirillum sp. J64-1]
MPDDQSGGRPEDPGGNGNGPSIVVSVECDLWTTTLTDVEDLARQVCAAALGAGITFWEEVPDLNRIEVSVVLTDDETVRILNRDYRGKDKPTNVLSFASLDDEDAPLPEDGPILLGDIVIAYQTTAAEAAEEGKTFTHHLTHLLVHGLLHLLGFDHEDESEAEEMEGMETAILAALGVPDPYQQPAKEHGVKE